MDQMGDVKEKVGKVEKVGIDVSGCFSSHTNSLAGSRWQRAEPSTKLPILAWGDAC